MLRHILNNNSKYEENRTVHKCSRKYSGEEIRGLVGPRNLMEQVGFELGLKERWNLDKHTRGGSISVEENSVQFPSLDTAKLLVILATSV